jgi:hypothetical protein
MNSANKWRSFAEPEQVIRFDLQPKNYTKLICHSTFYPAVEIMLSHRGCVSRQRGHDWSCMFWYKTCTIQIILLLTKSNRERTHVNERVFQSGQHILMNLMQIAYLYIHHFSRHSSTWNIGHWRHRLYVCIKGMRFNIWLQPISLDQRLTTFWSSPPVQMNWSLGDTATWMQSNSKQRYFQANVICIPPWQTTPYFNISSQSTYFLFQIEKWGLWKLTIWISLLKSKQMSE